MTHDTTRNWSAPSPTHDLLLMIFIKFKSSFRTTARVSLSQSLQVALLRLAMSRRKLAGAGFGADSE